MDVVNISAWEGRTKTQTGSVAEALAAQIHVALNAKGSAPKHGDPLPPLWHWCAFTPTAANSELSADGHPKRGDFLPPIYLDRRMWAGGALEFHAPICVGDPLKSNSTILKVEEKGRDNPMVFVTVQHDIRGPLGLAVRERQTLAYLNVPDSYAPPPKRAMPEAFLTQESLRVDETTLFRFSAVTFNAHRIHYDLNYTRNVEKYPELVIHGPFQAMLLMQLAQAQKGSAPRLFEFRGVHPMLLGADLDLMASEDEDGGLKLFAGQSGHQGTVARAVWEGTV